MKTTVTQKLGSELAATAQRKALSKFVHRFTKDHKPAWAREPMPNGKPYPVQFASDSDWLAHTHFFVNQDGTLSARHKYCMSNPTWPDKNASLLGNVSALELSESR